MHGYCLQYLDYYTEWIKPRGWCHKVILKREQLNYYTHLTGAEPPPDDVEQPSESTLRSHRAAYEAAKQGGSGKTYKRARATLLETLKIHGLEGEYYYIIRGKKGPPVSKLETVSMEVCGEGETATSQGGGDAPLGRKQVSWEEQVQAEEEQRPKDNPGRQLPPPPPRSTTPPAMPHMVTSTSDDGFIIVQG